LFFNALHAVENGKSRLLTKHEFKA
jgi:hypothetical protein